MGIIKGLKQINDYVEGVETRKNFVKAVWFKVGPKQSVKVRFLQELDEEAPGYSEKAGLGFLATEHNNPGPKLFMHKALCSREEEGRCWACEKHQQEAAKGEFGWKQKTRLYINVLVDNGVDAPFVAVLSQGRTSRSIVEDVLDYANEEGTLTDKWFEIKNIGDTPKESSYRLKARGDVGDDEPSPDELELFDLDNVVRTVSYDDQEAHYRAAEGVTPEPALAGTSPDLEWV